MNNLVDIYIGLRKSTSDQSFEVVKNFVLEATETQGPFKERIEKLIDYNMKGISKSIVQIIPYLFAQLNPKATTEELFQAQIMGWLLSLGGMAIFIVDDICDKAKTRNGLPCWHLLPEVGKTAVLDTNMLLSFTPLAVNHFFKNHPCYRQIAFITNKGIVTSNKGQLMDTEDNHKSGSDDIDTVRFTWNRYKDITVDKGTFGEVMRLPFYLSGETNESLHEELQKLGSYSPVVTQIIDDYLDVFPTDGSPGTDIEEGKLTWCILKALDKASPELRNILEQNYGKKDKKCVRAVKKVFRELDLKKDFDLEMESKEEAEEILASIVKASEGSKVLGQGRSSSYVATLNKFLSCYKQNTSLLQNLWG